LRAFVPGMIARGTPAHVEITASMAGLIATGMSGIYTASKFAAVAIAESLARDLQSVGAPIGVSVLCPSAVNTAIGTSQRNREDAVHDDSGAEAIEQILVDFCSKGIDPNEVGQMVVDAIRDEQFLIPTRDTAAEFIRIRSEALQRNELPPFQMFD
jgi:short-subunit dehydrogenase